MTRQSNNARYSPGSACTARELRRFDILEGEAEIVRQRKDRRQIAARKASSNRRSVSAGSSSDISITSYRIDAGDQEIFARSADAAAVEDRYASFGEPNLRGSQRSGPP